MVLLLVPCQWVPKGGLVPPGLAAAGQGYRGRGYVTVARRPQGQERGPTARGDDPTVTNISDEYSGKPDTARGWPLATP